MSIDNSSTGISFVSYKQEEPNRAVEFFRCVFFIVGALIINGLFIRDDDVFLFSPKNDLLGYMVMQ